MNKHNDPAYKYLPKSTKTDMSSKGAIPTEASGEAKHGLFTDIAYVTAWAVGLLGSLAGVLMILPALQGGYNASANLLVGVGIVAGSWVSASGLGVLAEISRKLSGRIL